MDEYAALAQRVALTLDDVRGCLVLSRDGLVLGAHPEQEESVVKQAWLRFAHVGEARRGFVEFGDQIWGFVHRGPYAAFIVAGSSVRPGILLDQLEQILLAAEEARTKRDAVKVPDAAAAPSGRPRTTLHPTPVPQQPAPAAAVPAAPQVPAAGAAVPPVATVPPVASVPRPASVPTNVEAPLGSSGSSGPPPAVPEDAEPHKEKKKDKDKEKDKDKKGGSPFSREPQQLVSSGWMPTEGEQPDDGSDDPSEIDRVMLAKEFSGLLQLDETGDEGSS